MSCAHSFGEWCSECIDLTVRQLNEARAENTRLTQSCEALRQERDEARANNARSICVWCGTISPFPNGSDATPEERVRVMWEHAEGCNQRPEKRLADEIDALQAQLASAKAEALREAAEELEQIQKSQTITLSVEWFAKWLRQRADQEGSSST